MGMAVWGLACAGPGALSGPIEKTPTGLRVSPEAVCARAAPWTTAALPPTWTGRSLAAAPIARGQPACHAILNPERGFFAFRDLLAPADLEGLRNEGITLIYGRALLADYRTRALDDQLLERVRAGFAAVRRAGLKVLPRFYYAADEKAPDVRPARALEHIAALAPVLRENADVIAALHAGFIGAWGEWHPENRATLAERKQIVSALLEALPADRAVLVRRPFYKQALFDPMGDAAAFARLGHLNDCFLASGDDQGTYRTPGERSFAIT
ncbi:MAG TPA: DUF4874 domain-containing protein, partial [Polyangia bacterium]